MKADLLSLVLVIAATLAGFPAHAQSPQLDVMLDRIAGTLDVSSMPYMKEGKLSGCQLVFDAMVRDYSYRQGRFIKVSGAIGVMHSGGPETPIGTIVKVVVSEIAEANGSLASTPSPPTRAYLIGPDYTTNLDSLVSAAQSDVPGGLFSIFQINPTLAMVIGSMKTRKITVAFNQMGGSSDIRLPLDLDVVATDENGQRQRSEQIVEDFAGCLGAIGKQLSK
ncbi:hypothetical protein [Rhizobium sp. 18055]|uniref:hypothetical protein n=1 Tax=Rhizobium sp. 18055 TaxID=2681403 RepID=UPI00135AC746|nr:hypothetical protein [Rhizobium sp. 18055]